MLKVMKALVHSFVMNMSGNHYNTLMYNKVRCGLGGLEEMYFKLVGDSLCYRVDQ
jgi:hypothetical protein